MNKQIVLVADNVRSLHNVGSLFRTAECLGVKKLYLCGYTPHPSKKNDERLPHVVARNESQISKTALGTEKNLEWQYYKDVADCISQLKDEGFTIAALEQAENSIKLNDYSVPKKVALIVGNEPNGIDKSTLVLCNDIIEIPMYGKKESLNVVQAAAIALYALQEA